MKTQRKNNPISKHFYYHSQFHLTSFNRRFILLHPAGVASCKKNKNSNGEMEQPCAKYILILKTLTAISNTLHTCGSR